MKNQLQNKQVECNRTLLENIFFAPIFATD